MAQLFRKVVENKLIQRLLGESEERKPEEDKKGE